MDRFPLMMLEGLEGGDSHTIKTEIDFLAGGFSQLSVKVMMIDLRAQREGGDSPSGSSGTMHASGRRSHPCTPNVEIRMKRVHSTGVHGGGNPPCKQSENRLSCKGGVALESRQKS